MEIAVEMDNIELWSDKGKEAMEIQDTNFGDVSEVNPLENTDDGHADD